MIIILLTTGSNWWATMICARWRRPRRRRGSNIICTKIRWRRERARATSIHSVGWAVPILSRSRRGSPLEVGIKHRTTCFRCREIKTMALEKLRCQRLDRDRVVLQIWVHIKSSVAVISEIRTLHSFRITLTKSKNCRNNKNNFNNTICKIVSSLSINYSK